jgi:hypothetical protein
MNMCRALKVGEASSKIVLAAGSKQGSAAAQPLKLGCVAAICVIQNEPKLVPVQTSRWSSTSGRERHQETRASPASIQLVGVT